MNPRPSLAGAWQRVLHWRRDELVAACDRTAVLAHVAEAGAFKPRFAFMTMMSCGIAVLGLLQNSGAVIIGAMLISPLMGPIVELGMGLATFDARTVRGALRTAGVGVLLAVATAAAIARASPLHDATSEILARVSPTLFDLLVAVFSGLAGAYATITRKGEAMVGVAIATALMPPLAVVGFGIARLNAHVALGAGFLFMTNLLAIALSVTVVARLYGFGAQDSPRQSLWQAMLIIGVFVVLSVPLGLGLRRIALQSQVQVAARTVLEREATRLGGRITALRVDDVEGGRVGVDAVLLVPAHAPGLASRLTRALQQESGREITLRLREVLTASDATVARQQDSLAELRQSLDQLRQAEDARTQAAQSERDARAAVADLALGALGRLEPDGGGFRLRLDPRMGLSAAAAWRLERDLAARRDAAAPRVDVVPALQALPAWAATAPGASEPTGAEPSPTPGPAADAGADPAAIAAWALRRWGAGRVRLEGVARARNAAARAAYAAQAERLRQTGIEVDVGPLRTGPDRTEAARLGEADVLVSAAPAAASP